MGTKANPGDYDCYANAKMDEPMFILLARDPLAPSLVELWAALAGGNVIRAGKIIQQIGVELGLHPKHTPHKINEAEKCAAEMREWFNKNRK